MNMDQLTGVLDIGGTKILLGLIDQHSTLLARQRIETRPERGTTDVLARATVALRALLSSLGVAETALRAIGCSVPGPLDSKTGVVHFSPNLGWRNVPLVELLQQQFAVPIAIDDDAHCAALGEAWRGAARGRDNAVYVTISTGIGAGVILGGKLYRGAHGCAGEVGHISLETNGPRCSCGNSGCFEALASGSAIATRTREALLNGEPSVLATLHTDFSLLTAEEVAHAAASGDALATHILKSASEYLGSGLAAVACAFDPEIIVVGGGVIQANEELLQRARESFARRALEPLNALVSIVPAVLGDESALWGAATLVFPLRAQEVSHV